MFLTISTCSERLAEGGFGVLGSVMASGTRPGAPHLVPVVFVVARDRVAIPIDIVKPKSSMQLRRIENLESEPRATLLVDHRSVDWGELWWVRADLMFAGSGDVDAWKALFARRYPAYGEADAISSVLEFTIEALSGWSAAT